jgi:hypothetical protein
MDFTQESPMNAPRIAGTPAEVTTGAASAQSSTLDTIAGGEGANAVLLIASAPCRFLMGNNPTAVATSTYLAAGFPLIVAMTKDEKIAAIQESGAGKLSITALIVD